MAFAVGTPCELDAEQFKDFRSCMFATQREGASENTQLEQLTKCSLVPPQSVVRGKKAIAMLGAAIQNMCDNK